MKGFNTEVLEDSLFIDQQAFSGTVGPAHVEVHTELAWQTVSSNQEKGWHVCSEMPRHAATPSPTRSPTELVIVMFGDCFTDASCIYSPNDPSHYGSSDSCEAFSQVALTLHMAEFSTEKGMTVLARRSLVKSVMTYLLGSVAAPSAWTTRTSKQMWNSPLATSSL